jgi:hypothetical protein
MVWILQASVPCSSEAQERKRLVRRARLGPHVLYFRTALGDALARSAA